MPDPHIGALELGNTLVAYCDGTIPACCARLVRLLTQATTTGGPPVPPLDDDGDTPRRRAGHP